MVFDEATSSLDSSAEQTIVQSIRDISSNRTSIVIAHRLSTIIDADTIIVLRHGKVVEMGSHQELLSKNGIYQRLWELQNQAPNINLEGTVD